MTDNREDKPKKLTLSSPKLSFNKPLDSLSLTKSFVTSRSNTIVEVKKSRVTASSPSLNKLINTSNQDSDSKAEEFDKKLNILKAAKEAKSSEEVNRISTLSQLMAMNQPVSNKVATENEEKKDVLDETVKSEVTSIDPLENQQSPARAELSESIISSSVTAPAPVNNIPEEESTAFKKKTNITTPSISPVKSKIEEPKKLKKSDILHMLYEDDASVKTRSLASIKRAREKEKRKLIHQKQEKIYREVIIPESITVGELANRMSERAPDVIRELVKLGITATASQIIDADTAELLVTSLGHTGKKVQESDVENILLEINDPVDLLPRSPVVTVMGHIDHGKTSLLDALRSTDVISTEAGGITQHIGAYRVTLADGRAITFIDTPGHEVFTAMRTRGTKVTDVVILVVAADDGIKNQTIEAINHAKAANVPIIVAINKIDKPNINIAKVTNELLNHGLVSEEFGGDTIIVPVSALTKKNLDKLEEAILLVAEMQDLQANINCPAAGVVLEAKVDKGKGIIATVLVQRGRLKVGNIIVAGTSYGKIRRMNNDKGSDITSVGPSEPAEIYGLNEAPQAGDKFNVVQTEKQARDITDYRMRVIKEKKVLSNQTSLADLFVQASGGTENKELSLIIKGDVQGSIEAIVASLSKLPMEEVKLRILHHAIGGITESDIALAKASNALVLGFNVRANNNAALMAKKEKVDIRYYSIIYNLIDDIKVVITGMLSPIIHEVYIGSVEIRQIFNITKVGNIAGSYVTKGVIKKGASVRLLRDNMVIHTGKLKTLKRFKEDVKEVKEGFECGIAFENHHDIKVNDIVEVFEIVEEKKQFP